jgi:GT2 family glycosyltransferase
MAKPNLIIAWTDFGMHPGDFTMTLLTFLAYDWGHRQLHAGTIRGGGAYPDDNHNNVVQEFLDKCDSEWLLTMDADMCPRPEQFYQLVDAADYKERPIVSGLYFGYVKTSLDTGGLAPVQMMKHGHGYRTLLPSDFPVDGNIMEVDSVGSGFCLVHRSVFETMAAQPDFKYCQWYGRVILDHGNNISGRYGEDIAFAARAQACGYKLWLRTDIVIDHIKSRKENLDTFVERVLGRKAVQQQENAGRSFPAS